MFLTTGNTIALVYIIVIYLFPIVMGKENVVSYILVTLG